MILGFLLGRGRDNFGDPEGIRFRTHELVRKFRDKYIQEYGSVVCRDIQTKVLGRPYYLADPDEFAKFHDAGPMTSTAPRWWANLLGGWQNSYWKKTCFTSSQIATQHHKYSSMDRLQNERNEAKSMECW